MEPIYIRTPWLLAKIIGPYTAMTVRPFIFMPRWRGYMSDAAMEIIRKHELCHFRHQGEMGLLRYLWLYWRDKGFRLNEELTAILESVSDESDEVANWEFNSAAEILKYWQTALLMTSIDTVLDRFSLKRSAKDSLAISTVISVPLMDASALRRTNAPSSSRTLLRMLFAIRRQTSSGT